MSFLVKGSSVRRSLKLFVLKFSCSTAWRERKICKDITGFLHKIWILLVAWQHKVMWIWSRIHISTLCRLSSWGHLPHEKIHCPSPCWQQYESYLWRRCTERGSDTFLQQNKRTNKPSFTEHYVHFSHILDTRVNIECL